MIRACPGGRRLFQEAEQSCSGGLVVETELLGDEPHHGGRYRRGVLGHGLGAQDGFAHHAVEALGQLYADEFDLSVICLRIGSFEQAPTEPWHLATWLSPRDAVGYIRAALTAPPSTRFATVYAVSAHTRRFWELPNPAVLAYVPVDDAQRHAEDIPGTDLPADPAAPQAGPYALPEFTLEHLRP